MSLNAQLYDVGAKIDIAPTITIEEALNETIQALYVEAARLEKIRDETSPEVRRLSLGDIHECNRVFIKLSAVRSVNR